MHRSRSVDDDDQDDGDQLLLGSNISLYSAITFRNQNQKDDQFMMMNQTSFESINSVHILTSNTTVTTTAAATTTTTSMTSTPNQHQHNELIRISPSISPIPRKTVSSLKSSLTLPTSIIHHDHSVLVEIRIKELELQLDQVKKENQTLSKQIEILLSEKQQQQQQKQQQDNER